MPGGGGDTGNYDPDDSSSWLLTAKDRKEMVRLINSFDTANSYFVQTVIYPYQATTAAMRAKTGVDGTRIVSGNFISVYKDGDWVDVRSKEAVRTAWLENVSDKESRDHDEIMAAFVKAAQHPIPSEFTVHLPIPRRFRNDPVYGDIFQRQSNGASNEDVIKGLIPFAQTRGMIVRIQDEMMVPMHHIKILSHRLNDAPMPRGRMH